MTKFFCTYCGQKLSAKESMLGTFVSCPACNNSIEVPDFLKPQQNRFATIPLSPPAPPARPGGTIAPPASPVAVVAPEPVIVEEPPAPEPIIRPPAAPAVVAPPVAPELIEEPPAPEPAPPPPAATVPPASPFAPPATPAAVLTPASPSAAPAAPAPIEPPPSPFLQPAAALPIEPPPSPFQPPAPSVPIKAPPSPSLAPAAPALEPPASPFLQPAGPAAVQAGAPADAPATPPPAPAPTFYPKPSQFAAPPAAPDLGSPASEQPIAAPASSSPPPPPPLPEYFLYPEGMAPQPHAPASYHTPQTFSVAVKSHSAATLLSLFFPGVGQIYNGQPIIGTILFLLTVFFYYCGAWIFAVPLHIYVIADANHSAKRINRQHALVQAGMAPPGRTTSKRRDMIIASIALALIFGSIGFIAWKLATKKTDAELDAEEAAADITSTTQTAATKEAPAGIKEAPAATKEAPAATKEATAAIKEAPSVTPEPVKPAGPVHFSRTDREGWTSAVFHRLQLRLPAVPRTQTTVAPSIVRPLLEPDGFDQWDTTTDKCKITLLHTTAIGTPNLQGAVKGATASVAALPFVSGFESDTEEVTISGRPAAFITMRFSMKNIPHNQYALYLLDGKEMWNITIIGRTKDVPDLWKRIRESVQLEQPQ